jgi:hypothetical protein
LEEGELLELEEPPLELEEPPLELEKHPLLVTVVTEVILR